jgi:hypothetical protein
MIFFTHHFILKNFIFFSFLFLICGQISTAQPQIDWIVQENLSPYGTYGKSVSTNPDGSVYVSGGFIGPNHGNDSMSQGGYLIKYNSAGNLIWQKMLYTRNVGDIGVLNAADSHGNVFIGRKYSNNLQFGDSMYYGSGMFFFKYNSAGNLMFSKGFPYAQALKIRIDRNDNIFIAGYLNTDYTSLYDGNILNTSSFLAKYDNGGNLLWVKDFFFPFGVYGSSDLFIDSHHNIYSAGTFTGTKQITSSVSITSTGTSDGYIAKYDSMLNLQWVKTITGNFPEEVSAIVVDSDENIFIGGTVDNSPGSGNSYFDTIAVIHNGIGKNDIFIAKYNSMGNCVWVNSIFGNGIDYVRSMRLDFSGNILFTGECNGYGDSIVFGNQTINSSDHYSYDFFISSFDTNGNFQWVKYSAGGGGQGLDLVISNAGNIFVTGEFGGAFSIDALSLNANHAMFLLALHDNTSTSINQPILNHSDISIYPNPCHEIFYITLPKTIQETITFNIYTTQGQLIYSETVNEFAGSHRIALNALPGVYYLRAEGKKESFVKKLVVY